MKNVNKGNNLKNVCFKPEVANQIEPFSQVIKYCNFFKPFYDKNCLKKTKKLENG
jgi:hypothetical protein